ncbi:ABC-2 type transport system ATP-binding protein [Motilibacter peucedani]|uniref:ABC-2 type transport system ATP-binding protein n=1 Tax=Motilibacter peucedani TaxID=598650 RepID=A0A420XMB8_9ACTN|nr:ABC transporter ATP-binding protein [Motilibacter peucedani]RKS72440.1 ABC-2 type transport system ATP-binding protein [Motilibacter peucedani]
MQSSAAVRARSVTTSFGEVRALDSVDLDVVPGEVHGLVGPNGAGKTTLLGLLLGLAVPDEGELEVLGTRVGRTLAVPAGVAGFVDAPGLYPTLTARQNLVALARLRGSGGTGSAREVDGALEQVGLTDVAGDRVRGFSLGMRQRLGLAAALMTRPRLLVLDEPVNGLDPSAKHHVHAVLARLADEGVAIVLSSHRMDDLAALCSDVTILSTGRVVFSGSVDKLAVESGELDHRVLTSHPERARQVAEQVPDVHVAPAGPRSAGDALVVRGGVAALDQLVVRLVAAGVLVREFGPVVPPLEAAFLALTGSSDEEPG